MSRIGKMPIPVPGGVTVDINGTMVTVKGPKGELKRSVSDQMMITKADDVILVERPSDAKMHRSMHGLTRTLLANMVAGVTEGFVRRLEIIGVGYRANLKGQDLEILVGYSHPVLVKKPAGIDFTVEGNKISVSGIDKEQVGQVAANIRAIRKPEPYKGKGIRFENEYVRRKAGKTAS